MFAMNAHVVAALTLLACAGACACASKPASKSPPPAPVAAAPSGCLDPAIPAPAPGVLTARLVGPKAVLRSLPPIDGLMIERETGRVISATDGEVYAIGTRTAMAAVTAEGLCVQVIEDEVAYARRLETVLDQIVDIEPSDDEPSDDDDDTADDDLARF
jgi:hypothetical protein